MIAVELAGAYLAGAVSTLVLGVLAARRQFRKMRTPRILP